MVCCNPYTVYITEQYMFLLYIYNPTNHLFFSWLKYFCMFLKWVKLLAEILEKVCLVAGFNPSRKYARQIGNLPK